MPIVITIGLLIAAVLIADPESREIVKLLLGLAALALLFLLPAVAVLLLLIYPPASTVAVPAWVCVAVAFWIMSDKR